MELDFLGISGKDSGVVVKEETRGGRQDSAFLVGSNLLWPFSNKVSTLQQFMAYKAAQEERPKKIVFDQFSSSGYPPVSSMDSQKGMHQLPMHPYQSPNNDSLGVSKHQVSEIRTYPVVSHHSIPVPTSSPFFQIHGAPNGPSLMATSIKQQAFVGGIAEANSAVVGSTVGAFAPRITSKPSSTTAQLTIFYGGTVNVYDDVPLDKAQAIMFLASNSSNLASNMANPRTEAPILTPIKATKVEDDRAGIKAVGTLAPASQNEPPKTATQPIVPTACVPMMPRAVPQARKASLARFLEKRKERVSNALPYVCPKNSGVTSGIEDNLCSKASSPDIALSSNMEQSWCAGQSKNTDSRDSPSTELEM
ncbi:Tify domain-containing protein [Dioscorea alata]|uniref:Tify domain-containing protein n=1 Tax=Dioscorea alata TaxID=55571 RepID=A0ACB7VYL6_DIOAL|nr:Tify domain-containing protein [Dioscorea alata]